MAAIQDLEVPTAALVALKGVEADVERGLEEAQSPGWFFALTEIKTDEEAAKITLVTERARDVRLEFEKSRKVITGPLNKVKTAVDREYGKVEKPAKKIEDHGRDLLGRYHEKKEADQLAADAAAQLLLDEEHAGETAQAAVTGEIAPAAPAEVVEHAVSRKLAGGAKVRKKWTAELIPEQIALVPDEYYSINPKLVQDAVDAGVREIPGVRIWEKSIPVLG